jgi:hypothetical protein
VGSSTISLNFLFAF